MRLLAPLALGLVCAWTPSAAAAESSIDPDASVVELRAPASPECPTCTGCETTQDNFLDNCFETTSSLTDWLWVDAGTSSGRASAPNSLDEVQVRVGPGDFDALKCEGPMNGWVSFQGAGRDHTRFNNTDANVTPDDVTLQGACEGGVTVRHCTNLSFSDLTVQGYAGGAIWVGIGNSDWRAVDMIADSQGIEVCARTPGFGLGIAWYDVGPVNGGVHFFWSNRFVARGPAGLFLIAFDSSNGENWIYGSDILLESTGSRVAIYSMNVNVFSGGSVRMFGSTVRNISPAGTRGTARGIRVDSGGEFHMHGGIVNMLGFDVSLVSIDAVGGVIHTPETAFVFNGDPTAERTRISNVGSATVESPFLWPPSTSAPNIRTTDGSDMFVKTDGGASGTESVLYLSDNDCPAPHWRSAADGSCL